MTVEFAKIGDPLKNGTLQVYLRYSYKNSWLSSKWKYEYVPTKIFLPVKEVELLLADKLGGKTAHRLYAFKDRFTKAVTDFYDLHNSYPDKHQVLTKLKQKGKKAIEFISEYRQHIKGQIKQSTYDTYVSMIQNLTEKVQRLEGIDKKHYLEDADLFASEETTKRIIEYYSELGHSNGYIRPVKRLLVRIQNFIREQTGKRTIKPEIKTLKTSYDHLQLTSEEIGWIISYKTTNKKYIETQHIVKVNHLIGLRISEILNLYVEDLIFEKDHVKVQIHETKKSKSRSVVVIDEEVIKLFKQLRDKIKTGLLFQESTKDKVNYRLKRIAKATGKFNALTLVVKNSGMKSIQKRIPKWKRISTHSIRRYAVTKNANKHGLIVSAYFSGHTDLQTIQKHYLGQIDDSEILDKLRENK